MLRPIDFVITNNFCCKNTLLGEVLTWKKLGPWWPEAATCSSSDFLQNVYSFMG